MVIFIKLYFHLVCCDSFWWCSNSVSDKGTYLSFTISSCTNLHSFLLQFSLMCMLGFYHALCVASWTLSSSHYIVLHLHSMHSKGYCQLVLVFSCIMKIFPAQFFFHFLHVLTWVKSLQVYRTTFLPLRCIEYFVPCHTEKMS